MNGRVGFEALTGEAQELGRGQAVPRQEAMHRLRMTVAVLARIAHQHAAATATEHQCGAEPRGAAADDDHVPG